MVWSRRSNKAHGGLAPSMHWSCLAFINDHPWGSCVPLPPRAGAPRGLALLCFDLLPRRDVVSRVPMACLQAGLLRLYSGGRPPAMVAAEAQLLPPCCCSKCSHLVPKTRTSAAAARCVARRISRLQSVGILCCAEAKRVRRRWAPARVFNFDSVRNFRNFDHFGRTEIPKKNQDFRYFLTKIVWNFNII